MGPAGFLRHPEDVLGFVFVGVFGIGPGVVAFAFNEFRAVFLEGVGDVFEEDEPKDDVLVFRRVHIVAQLVGGEPELGLKANGGGGLGGGWGFRAGHTVTGVSADENTTSSESSFELSAKSQDPT